MATNLKQHLRGKPNVMEAGGENREKNKGSSDSIEAMQCDRRLRIIWRCTCSEAFIFHHTNPVSTCNWCVMPAITVKALTQWGLHRYTSLQSLSISGCHKAECFPDEKVMILPTTLTHLSLERLPKLKTSPLLNIWGSRIAQISHPFRRWAFHLHFCN